MRPHVFTSHTIRCKLGPFACTATTARSWAAHRALPGLLLSHACGGCLNRRTQTTAAQVRSPQQSHINLDRVAGEVFGVPVSGRLGWPGGEVPFLDLRFGDRQPFKVKFHVWGEFAEPGLYVLPGDDTGRVVVAKLVDEGWLVDIADDVFGGRVRVLKQFDGEFDQPDQGAGGERH